MYCEQTSSLGRPRSPSRSCVLFFLVRVCARARAFVLSWLFFRSFLYSIVVPVLLLSLLLLCVCVCVCIFYFDSLSFSSSLGAINCVAHLKLYTHNALWVQFERWTHTGPDNDISVAKSKWSARPATRALFLSPSLSIFNLFHRSLLHFPSLSLTPLHLYAVVLTLSFHQSFRSFSPDTLFVVE